MENPCMQYLVVSFLRWVATSCVMWGSLTYLSTPSFAATYRRVDLPVAVAHQVHPVPLDRRARVARQVHRVQAAPRDRTAAVVPPVPAPEAEVDQMEAPAPQGKAAVKGLADTQDPVAPRVAVDHPVRAGHQVARVPVVARVRREVVARLAARDHQVHRGLRDRPERAVAHQADPVVQVLPVRVAHQAAAHLGAVPRVVVRRGVVRRGVVHLEARGQKVALAIAGLVDQVAHPVPNLPAAADPKADPGANLALVLTQAPNPVRSLDHRVAASHRARAQDHRDQVVAARGQAEQVPADLALVANRPVAAMEVDPVQVRAVVPVQVHQAMVPAVLVPAVSVARGNRTARVEIVVDPRGAVAARVQRVVAVARAITNGTVSVGLPLACPIRALLRWDPFKRSAFALGTSQQVPDHLLAKPFTQGAKKVWHE